MKLLISLSLTFFLQVAVAADGESIPTSEAQDTNQIVKLIRDTVYEEFDKTGHAFRDAHRKQHGCVKAEFTVLSNLTKEYRYGIFATPKTYSAIIRYSNGSGKAQDDHDGDGRGMAVKILNVSGQRLQNDADEEKNTQDFLMINHPVFFVRNASDYVGFNKSANNGLLPLWLMSPLRVFHEGRIATTIAMKKMINPLDSRYWSMTASKIGPQQMKFSAKPCTGSQFHNPSDSANRLRENLQASLNAQAACFDFQIQLRTKPTEMPVEDPTIEWDEQTAPFKTVAQIKIPVQKAEQGEACEIISMNPWNGTTDLRPLGGISRVRREVYREISKLRHELNHQPRKEPL